MDAARGTSSRNGPSAAEENASLRDPLAWSAAERCLFASSVYFVFTLWYWIVIQYLIGPAAEPPYVASGFLPTALRVQSAMLGIWLAVIASALAARRWRPDSRRLVHLTCTGCIAELAYGSWVFGRR